MKAKTFKTKEEAEKELKFGEQYFLEVKDKEKEVKKNE
jgi:hypothetical protein